MVLKHNETGKLLIVGNTHLYWDDKFDYVKYAQAFCMLKELQRMRLLHGKDTPIVLGADMNCKASSSAVHLMMGQPYLLSKASGRCDPNTGLKAYKVAEGGQRFERVNKFVQEERADLPVFKSAYQNYRQGPQDKLDLSKQEDLIAWAQLMDQSHPERTIYTSNHDELGDFIFYTGESVTLSKVLELPDDKALAREKNRLPSKRYPSDHLRIAAEFVI